MLSKCRADPETRDVVGLPAEDSTNDNPVIELPNCSCMKTSPSEPVFVLMDAHTSTYIHAKSKTGHCAAQEPELILPSRRSVRESQT